MKNDKGENKFVFVSEKEIKKDNNKNKQVKEYDIKKRIYFGFKQRVIILIGLIIILFALGTFLVFNSYMLKKGEIVKYSELSTSDYEVCLLENEIYSEECLKSGKNYNSMLVNNIKTNFTYNVDFSEDIDYQLYYNVVIYNRIYDKDDKSKVLFEKEETIVDKTFVDKKSKKISFDVDAVIDYKKYNNILFNYKTKYYQNAVGELDVKLYLDETSEEREISSIVIPMGEDSFKIKQKNLSNKNKTVEVENEEMNKEAEINLFFGSFLITISLILDILLVRLVKTTFTRRSRYELELQKILKEYDDNIVSAVSNYKYDNYTNIIKVDSIKELLDASNIIGKPIVYYRINNVKSEFIVEDDDKIYRYVLKDRD